MYIVNIDLKINVKECVIFTHEIYVPVLCFDGIDYPITGTRVRDKDEDMQTSKTRVWRWWIVPLVIVILLTLTGGGFVIWAMIPTGELQPEVDLALESDSNVTVTNRRWLGFIPNMQVPQAGVIIYQGGKVPAEAYAPLARRLAEQGIIVGVVDAPLDITLFRPNGATDIMENFSAVDHWVLVGHSLGGTTAANYTARNPAQVAALVWLASYPISDVLADSDVPLVSVYGTQDAIATPDEITSRRADMPDDTRFIPIAGGNHSQFAYYGTLPSDVPATITQDEQIAQTVAVITDIIAETRP